MDPLAISKDVLTPELMLRLSKAVATVLNKGAECYSILDSDKFTDSVEGCPVNHVLKQSIKPQ